LEAAKPREINILATFTGAMADEETLHLHRNHKGLQETTTPGSWRLSSKSDSSRYSLELCVYPFISIFLDIFTGGLSMRRDNTTLENDRTGVYERTSHKGASDGLLGSGSAGIGWTKQRRFPNLARPDTSKTTSARAVSLNPHLAR
jgi:hypothetical protein